MTEASGAPAPTPADLEREIDYCFLEEGLLADALRHASAGEGTGGNDNRRLAFLGDAVIELAVRERAYRTASLRTRGALSMDADKQVSDAELAVRARRLGLGRWLRVGRGEAGNPAGEDRRLADAFEALAGAIYLDAGAHAFPVVRRMMGLDDETGE